MPPLGPLEGRPTGLVRYGIRTDRLDRPDRTCYCSYVVGQPVRSTRNLLSNPMNFNLPASLAVKLSAYDPTKPKVRRTASGEKKPASIGQPTGLIPAAIVSDADQLAAVGHIRLSLASERYMVWRDNLGKIKAGMFHYEKTWVGLWLDTDCLYGFCYVTRDPDLVRKHPDLTWSEVKYGRVTYQTARQLVTRDDVIRDRFTGDYWSMSGRLSGWRNKSQTIYSLVITPIYEAIKAQLPRWTDKSWGSIYQRLQATQSGVLDAMEIGYAYTDWFKTHNKEFNGPNVVEMFSNKFANATRILNAPAIRRLVINRVDEVIADYNDLDNTLFRPIQAKWESLCQFTVWANSIVKIWPDVQIDYFINHFDSVGYCNTPYNVGSNVTEWIIKHMNPSIMFNLFVRAEKSGHRAEVRDTLMMLSRVADVAEPPARWRDLHDHLSAIEWKKNTELVKLPQDLFTSPVKFDGWTFFQPSDTHQLAEWGRAVRNCVGGSGYADGVRKKKHFIVLCMFENKPKFTVQLKVEGERMHVTQIVGQSNSRLSSEESEMYSKAFTTALSKIE